jgi:hypothetical protein
MSRALATRHLLTGAPIPNRLLPGQELWRDNPHRLAARITQAKRRGQVLELRRWELAPGLHVALVLRLKPRPTWRTRAPLWALLGLLGLAAVTVVGRALAEALGFLGWLAVPAVMLSLAAVIGVRSQAHSVTCVGLHCPGCRG